jgi:hypothetical protein
MSKPKQPPGDPMTLGNMRRLAQDRVREVRRAGSAHRRAAKLERTPRPTEPDRQTVAVTKK